MYASYVEQKKVSSYNILKKKMGDYMEMSQDSFCKLSLLEIENLEASVSAAIKSGELKDVTASPRSERINGKNKSLLAQAAELRGWVNPNEIEDENRSAGKINFK